MELFNFKRNFLSAIILLSFFSPLNAFHRRTAKISEESIFTKKGVPCRFKQGQNTWSFRLNSSSTNRSGKTYLDKVCLKQGDHILSMKPGEFVLVKVSDDVDQLAMIKKIRFVGFSKNKKYGPIKLDIAWLYNVSDLEEIERIPSVRLPVAQKIQKNMKKWQERFPGTEFYAISTSNFQEINGDSVQSRADVRFVDRLILVRR